MPEKGERRDQPRQEQGLRQVVEAEQQITKSSGRNIPLLYNFQWIRFGEP